MNELGYAMPFSSPVLFIRLYPCYPAHGALTQSRESGCHNTSGTVRSPPTAKICDLVQLWVCLFLCRDGTNLSWGQCGTKQRGLHGLVHVYDCHVPELTREQVRFNSVSDTISWTVHGRHGGQINSVSDTMAHELHVHLATAHLML